MKVKEFQKKTFKILQNLRYFDTIFNVFSNHTSVYFFVDKQNDQVDFFCWSRERPGLRPEKFCIVFNTIFNVFSNHTSLYFFVDNFVLYSIQYLTFFRTIQACTFLLTNRKCVLFCWQTNKQTNKQTNRTTKLIFFAGLEKDPAFGRNKI